MVCCQGQHAHRHEACLGATYSPQCVHLCYCVLNAHFLVMKIIHHSSVCKRIFPCIFIQPFSQYPAIHQPRLVYSHSHRIHTCAPTPYACCARASTCTPYRGVCISYSRDTARANIKRSSAPPSCAAATTGATPPPFLRSRLNLLPVVEGVWVCVKGWCMCVKGWYVL